MAVLLGGQSVDTVEEHGAVVVGDQVRLPRLQKFFLQVVYYTSRDQTLSASLTALELILHLSSKIGHGSLRFGPSVLRVHALTGCTADTRALISPIDRNCSTTAHVWICLLLFTGSSCSGGTRMRRWQLIGSPVVVFAVLLARPKLAGAEFDATLALPRDAAASGCAHVDIHRLAVVFGGATGRGDAMRSLARSQLMLLV